MKTSIIFLGLVALSFTNANATTEFETQVLDQQESTTLIVENTQEQNELVLLNEGISSKTGKSEVETAVFDPKSVIKTTYVKVVEDVIAEDKLITDSNEVVYQPLFSGFTFEDRIAEDNQIIEGSISNEVFPLDFNKINRSVKINNNAIITADLKL